MRESSNMLSTMKDIIRDSDLRPYLETPYHLLIKRPYWHLRSNLYPRRKENIAGIDVTFTVESPQELHYHEVNSEEPVIKDVISELTQKDVFFDIGANMGLYSCTISNKIGSENVVAFEPSPPAYDKLEKNSKLNGDFYHYQMAISDTDEIVEFAIDMSDKYARMSTMNTNSSATDYELQDVPARRLSSVVKAEDLPQPTIVKIDIEGAEFKALDGMEELFEGVRVIYVEIHHPYLSGFDTDGNEIIDYIESLGFNTQTLHQRTGNEFVKATKSQE